MAVAFSTTPEDIIQRQIQTKKTLLPDFISQKVEDYFETEKIVVWIRENNFVSVGLQFPDDLLGFSVRVTQILDEKLSHGGTRKCALFVLGDTSYGSCCVDEVAAQHGAAGGVIHFGPSCLSPPSFLSVFFVFGKAPIDVENLARQCSESFDSHVDVLLFYETVYAHARDKFSGNLKSILPHLIICDLIIPFCDKNETMTNASDTNELFLETCKRKVTIPDDKKLEDYKILYIGSEGPALNNAILHFKNEFFTYDPLTSVLRQESLNVNKSLMKRYFLIEKAKDANIIGILAGTLGVANCLKVINRLKELIRNAGKKFYTFVVGKLNVPKLANFQEIDVYVLVACPENSLIDSRDFFQPVLTPYELEVALNPNRSWESKMITDFSKLLPGHSEFVEIDEMGEERTDISLITGHLRKIGRDRNIEPEKNETSVMLRNEGALMVANAHSGAEFLQNRSWQGLEQDLGKTEVTKAVQGVKGIAMGYENEKNVDGRL